MDWSYSKIYNKTVFQQVYWKSPMGLHGLLRYLSLMQLMEDKRCIEKKRNSQIKDQTWYTMWCGSCNLHYMPPPFLHLMLHTNFVKINMKVMRRNKNRSTVYNQHCEYKVLWYTIYVLVRRESYFMQMNFIKLSQCIFQSTFPLPKMNSEPDQVCYPITIGFKYLYIIHICINYKVFDLCERILIVE